MIEMQFTELSTGIKKVADIVKKGENLELYGLLLDLYAKAIALQDENKELKEKLSNKRRVEELRARIVRHDQPIITLKDDNRIIYYCAHCWDSQEKLIQVNTEPRQAEFSCPACKNTGVYDQEVHMRYEESRKYRGPRGITVF